MAKTWEGGEASCGNLPRPKNECAAVDPKAQAASVFRWDAAARARACGSTMVTALRTWAFLVLLRLPVANTMFKKMHPTHSVARTRYCCFERF